MCSGVDSEYQSGTLVWMKYTKCKNGGEWCGCDSQDTNDMWIYKYNKKQVFRIKLTV